VNTNGTNPTDGTPNEPADFPCPAECGEFVPMGAKRCPWCRARIALGADDLPTARAIPFDLREG
jgi:hypothetical protein